MEKNKKMEILKSSITYRFKGWTGALQVIRFNGHSLSLGVLKKKIMEREKISSNDFDLQLRCTITSLIYGDQDEILTGTDVLVSRVPQDEEKSCISYSLGSFKSERELIHFTGSQLSQLDLKRKIMEREKISKTSFDLKLRCCTSGYLYQANDSINSGLCIIAQQVPSQLPREAECTNAEPKAYDVNQMLLQEKLQLLTKKTDVAVQSLIEVTASMHYLQQDDGDEEQQNKVAASTKAKKQKLEEEKVDRRARQDKLQLLTEKTDVAVKSLIEVKVSLHSLLQKDDKAEKKNKKLVEDSQVLYWRVIVVNGANYSPGPGHFIRELEDRLVESIEPLEVYTACQNLVLHIKSTLMANNLQGLSRSVDDPITGIRFTIIVERGPAVANKS
jgi:hypothetical protein